MLDKCSGKYCYDLLLSQKNGKNKQECYKEFMSLLREYYRTPIDMTKSFEQNKKQYWWRGDVHFGKYGLTWDEACEACYAVYNDYPVAFFVDTYKMGGNLQKHNIAPVLDYEFKDGDFRQSVVVLVEKKLKSDISGIKEKSPMKKAKEIYDLICEKGTYDYLKGEANYVDIPSHSIVGYFRNGAAVCEGFAKIYQAFLLFLGIPCICVTGHISNREGGGLHAWNMFYAESQWHQVDVTTGVRGGKGFCHPEMTKTHVLHERSEKSPQEPYRYLPRYPTI